MRLIKMSKGDRAKLKKAKKAFNNKMRSAYPDYTKANWAKTSWRINNPQFI